MDAWGWENLRPWLSERPELPAGPLFCVINGPTGGRPLVSCGGPRRVSRHAAEAGVRAALRAASTTSCACGRARPRGVSLNVIQRQLGHANLGTTSIYLQGIDIEEIISTVHARRAPMRSATSGLQL